LVAVVLVVTGSGTAAARNPWQLRCASMPVEQPPPAPVRPAVLRFFPWVRPAAGALHAGRVYLIALSSNTAIARDGDERDTADYYLHRALVVVAPSQRGAVTITGHRLGPAGRRTRLGFSTTGATHCTLQTPNVDCRPRPLRFAQALRIGAHTGWRVVATELRIGRTGCFRVTVTGRGIHEAIPLAVPGPDYGTPGW
jgi:hypothetical protein